MISEAKTDYDLCINEPVEYQRKVDDISNRLGLKGRNRLKGDNCAAYVIGRPESRFVMFSLNPGFSPDWNPTEDKELRRSWEVYQKFMLNFFKHNYSKDSRFFNGLGQLFCGLTGMKNKWECFDANLLNLELIPYHSEKLNLPNKLSNTQFDYLNDRFHNNLAYCRQLKRRLLIFNGKIFHTLLGLNKYLDKAEKVNIIKNFDIYLLEIDKTPSILFERFLGSAHYYGVKNYHLHTVIPKLIQEKFGG